MSAGSDPAEGGLAALVLDWWGFGVFLVSLVAGFLLGTARRTWTLEQLQTRLSAVEAQIAALRDAKAAETTAVAVIHNDLDNIKAAVVEIKKSLDRLR